jgi:hypothetical protein
MLIFLKNLRFFNFFEIHYLKVIFNYLKVFFNYLKVFFKKSFQ